MTAADKLRDEYVKAVGAVEALEKQLASIQHELDRVRQRRDTAHGGFLTAKAEAEAEIARLSQAHEGDEI